MSRNGFKQQAELSKHPVFEPRRSDQFNGKTCIFVVAMAFKTAEGRPRFPMFLASFRGYGLENNITTVKIITAARGGTNG